MCCAPAFAAERQISDCVPGVVRELADGRSEGVTLTRQIAQPAAAPPAAAPAAPAGRGARESSAQTEQPGGGGAAAAMCLEGVTAADAPAADAPAADGPEQPVAGVPAAGVPAADAAAMRQGVAATPLAMPLAMTQADVAPIPATPCVRWQENGMRGRFRRHGSLRDEQRQLAAQRSVVRAAVSRPSLARPPLPAGLSPPRTAFT
jgi:hypothetical protein